MIAVKALYKQGKVEFLDSPPDIDQALVAVVFLETETVEDALAPYLDQMDGMDWGEPMDAEGARSLLAMHEELAPYRTEAHQAYTPDAYKLDVEEA